MSSDGAVTFLRKSFIKIKTVAISFINFPSNCEGDGHFVSLTASNKSLFSAPVDVL